MTAFAELYLDQGTTFNNVINVTDDRTNAPINIAGYSVSSSMKPSYYSPLQSSNIACSITDAANGAITMSMTPGATSNLYPGKYAFDVKLVSPENVVSRILEGYIFVTPSVTK